MDGLKFIERCIELVYDAWHGEEVDVLLYGRVRLYKIIKQF